MLPAFYSQKVEVATQTLSLGETKTFNLPRESHIEKVVVWIQGTIGTGAATAAVEGLPALVQSISLSGSLAGQARFEPMNGLSGPDLYEMAQFIQGSLPELIGGLTSTALFRINIPLFFRDYGFDPVRNLYACIPAVRMSDLTLNVRIATQAQVDSNATPTFAFTGNPSIGVEVHQFYRETVPANWPFLRTSYEALTDDSIATSTDREVRLPAGGDYSMILARSFSGANTKQANTGSAPFTNPGRIRIDDLGLMPKIVTDFNRLRNENLSIVLDSLVAGNAALVFSRGADSLFQTGSIGKALNYVKVTYNATAASNAKIRFVYRRIFDEANVLQIAR